MHTIRTCERVRVFGFGSSRPINYICQLRPNKVVAVAASAPLPDIQLMISCRSPLLCMRLTFFATTAQAERSAESLSISVRRDAARRNCFWRSQMNTSRGLRNSKSVSGWRQWPDAKWDQEWSSDTCKFLENMFLIHIGI